MAFPASSDNSRSTNVDMKTGYVPTKPSCFMHFLEHY